MGASFRVVIISRIMIFPTSFIRRIMVRIPLSHLLELLNCKINFLKNHKNLWVIIIGRRIRYLFKKISLEIAKA